LFLERLKKKMRKLLNDDMYLISEIADKMNVELPKYPVINVGGAGKTAIQIATEKTAIQKDFGMRVIHLLVRKVYKAKPEVNNLIANVLEKKVEEVQKMPITETINILKNILKEDGVMDFFKSARD